jgi:transcriptional antiterminator RfaH
MKWYVLFTPYHRQRAVYERVMLKGFQPYLPLAAVWRKSQRGLGQVATPLFPRYVFIRCYLEMYTHLELISTPGVVRLQEDSQGRFLVVPDEEIQLLRRLGDSGSPLQRTAYRLQGSHVRFVQGLLRGICGVIRDEARTTLLVPIHSLQASIAVEISWRQVMPRIDMGEERSSGRFPEARRPNDHGSPGVRHITPFPG